MHTDLIFLKLGGSLITDKKSIETARGAVIVRLAHEIHQALDANPNFRLILGHGSGSYGHVAAAKHNTRHGVATKLQWHGFAAVSDAALRLNRIIVDALLMSGVPAMTISPSASAQCHNGQLESMSITSVQAALQAGIVPVIHGDVAFDTVRGGTIISTEEVMSYLAPHLQPKWLLLAGETEGVLGPDGHCLDKITPQTYTDIAPALQGSAGTDVTGGMASKVIAMLNLTNQLPDLNIRIFSGHPHGHTRTLLCNPTQPIGTLLTA
ncbi:MAG TPA: isopentenyl phosphate kinase [Anaerolineae bacterium]|nr:isopentenyl phosphate kinase [Anaerolineae bacterium]